MLQRPGHGVAGLFDRHPAHGTGRVYHQDEFPRRRRPGQFTHRRHDHQQAVILAPDFLGKEGRRGRGATDRLPGEDEIPVHLGHAIGQANVVDARSTGQCDIVVGRFHPRQRHSHIESHAHLQRVQGRPLIALLGKLQRRDGIGVAHLVGWHRPAKVGINDQRCEGLLRSARGQGRSRHIPGRNRGGKTQGKLTVGKGDLLYIFQPHGDGFPGAYIGHPVGK